MSARHLRSRLHQWLRRNWPEPSSLTPAGEGVAIVFVNYNTFDLTAYLLFSIFRILGTEQLSRIVAVDNNSTDGSRQLLQRFAEAGMIDLICNRSQNYHGPAINQAIAYLAAQQRGSGTAKPTRYIWILDSDVIILRKDAVVDAVQFLKAESAAAAGQFQYDALPEGYAHISSLLIDPVKAWRREIAPFDNTGAPAANFQLSLRAHGMKVGDFPYRTDHYLLHLARGTLKSISDRNEEGNLYFQWAKTHSKHHYHGDPGGSRVHELFLDLLRREVPEQTAEALLAACQKPERIEFPLPSA